MTISRVYPLLGLVIGYALLMLATPVRLALRDGFRCVARYERVWLTFAVLGLAYLIFQLATLTPLGSMSEIDPHELIFFQNWTWPQLSQVWSEAPLPALEALAGIFDTATTTFPLVVIAALLLVFNWQGVHGTLWRALRKLYGWWSIPLHTVILVSVLAALLKPFLYWKLPDWNSHVSTAHLLKISAGIDAAAFIFEYFVGVYIQVYLITVCLAWIKGLSFTESGLFAFAVRRFSYVLEWAGIIVVVSMIVVRLPLLLAYFINLPDVLDYLPMQRLFMAVFILLFCSVQISLVLHNESLRAALHAHLQLLRRDFGRVGWFLLIATLNFFLILTLDAFLRAAIGDRALLMIAWRTIFVFVRALVTGWLLASWVVLFRQCETGRVSQEDWIQY